MTELSDLLRLYINFFIPSVKLLKKIHMGHKVKKIYDQPKTPYQRVIESPHVPDTIKQELKAQYKSLNPTQLHKKIVKLQRKLYSLATPLKGVYYE